MKIKFVRSHTKAIGKFNDKEWQIADIEHYGARLRWTATETRIVALDGTKIVGSLKLNIKRGVCTVETIIVAHDRQGEGVGTALMQNAESFAKRHGTHKMQLETGKGWKAEKLYKKLGYKKIADLKEHYEGQDFVLYTKQVASR